MGSYGIYLYGRYGPHANYMPLLVRREERTSTGDSEARDTLPQFNLEGGWAEYTRTSLNDSMSRIQG
jgi:hypothetical protein